MIYRFVSLVWNQEDARAAATAEFIATQLHKTSPHAWEKAYEGAGIIVFQSGAHVGRMQAYRLAGDGGVVVGRLFRNDYTSQTTDLDAATSRKCLQTRGQHLVDNYWGRYITFLCDHPARTKYIMRDPVGDFPCFVTPYQGVDIYFSDMEDPARFDFLTFTINWEYIKKNLALPFLQKTGTGLNEVDEVLPAECRAVGPEETTSRFTWDPSKIAQTDIIEDAEEAARLVRETVMSCVGAWAGCYDNILHRIGGLDSSIVLACLAKAPKRPEITCSTFYSAAPSCDERFYTRQAADQAGVPLVEYELHPRNVHMERMLHMNRLSKPFPYFNGIDRGDFEVRLAQQKGAQAIFSGVGGDQLFLLGADIYSAYDYVDRYGIDAKLPKIIMQAARQSKKSVSSTIIKVLKNKYINRSQDAFEIIRDDMFSMRETILLNPDIRKTYLSRKALHPLLSPNKRIPAGKYYQILVSACFSIEYYEPTHRQAFVEPAHPLFSQPLVALCLRVPVWLLSLDGISRGLARKAFEHDVPQAIIRRQTKGTPTDYYKKTYMENKKFIRDLLMDGILVKENLIFRDKLDDVLSEKSIHIKSEYLEILYHASLEIWLNSWRDREYNTMKAAV